MFYAAPKRGIGAVGWISIMPYRTRAGSLRARLSPGPFDDVVIISLMGWKYSFNCLN
jgi:hypothetical protein